ncbi:exodeoxyribonuclease III [Candidatus Saccharibacteria bacterium]|nr:exodeoxyribonuclease III [Candidatus Saccharibacteria bacterium]
MLSLYSWNINGLRAVLKKGNLQDFIEKESPDILCLQEIKCQESQLLPLDKLSLEKNYILFWNSASRPGYSGTMILLKSSKFDKNSIKTIDYPGDLGKEEGRVLTLDLENFYLVNVYTPNSKQDLSRLSLRENSWDPEFRAFLKSLEKDKPVITCGDFNSAHEEIDLARPDTNHNHAGFTDPERQGITDLLSAGFIDTFRKKHPDKIQYTWWSNRSGARKNNVGWRIDYFFIPNSLEPSLVSAEILDSVLGSDHCPISITIKE